MMAGSLAILCFTAPEKAVSSLTCSAATSLEISLKLAGVYCLWLGVINVLKQSGAVGALSKKMQPLIKKLFKTQNDETTQNISINVSANLLGVGNAATPPALKAVKQTDDGSGKIWDASTPRPAPVLDVSDSAGRAVDSRTLAPKRPSPLIDDEGSIYFRGAGYSDVVFYKNSLLSAYIK